MAAFPAGLVWLASYPKSGNTWMRILLANLLAGRAEPADINRLSEEESLMGRWRFGDDMLVDADLLDSRELARMRPLHAGFVASRQTTPFFCKTHDRFAGEDGAPSLGAAARGAVYLLRDPRDVAISLAYHLGATVDEALARMTDPAHHFGGARQLPYLLGDWGGHVAGWTGQGLTPTHVVRYEDLRRDTAAVLRGVLRFLGGQATEVEVSRAIAHSSLEALQGQEAAKGFRERQPGQARFFRAGQVGEWQRVLTPAQLETIEEHFGAVMIRFGYAPAGATPG
ncbi:sulfotransferase domain-containing protein [Roseomonas stagni]|uniref:Sulfotransferase domain-containing protein n=1 Tax=Falsiroseomonas algicola TaxID=2716930 RepID=A0A6M1LXI5_9PROT|nr:sulfotransferase domain-containing protein [Falsiroseomonas algicola]NGM24194.1 sulfotransferase domain-containing protein [Falsiroseomonas algicola]